MTTMTIEVKPNPSPSMEASPAAAADCIALRPRDAVIRGHPVLSARITAARPPQPLFAEKPRALQGGRSRRAIERRGRFYLQLEALEMAHHHRLAGGHIGRSDGVPEFAVNRHLPPGRERRLRRTHVADHA